MKKKTCFLSILLRQLQNFCNWRTRQARPSRKTQDLQGYGRVALVATKVLQLSLLSALVGCSSPKVIRTGQYVDMDNDRLHVVYFEKAHTEFVNGVEFPFKEAVKIRLPDGKNITCLRTVSPGGMRYRSSDNKYIFYEKGPYCILFLEGKRIFEGIFCRDKD